MGRKNNRSTRKPTEETVETTAEETVEETVETTAEETVEETVETTAEETVEKTVEETVEKTVEETATEDHPAIKNIKNILKDYNSIATKPTFDKSVVSAHYNLYYALKNILNNENKDIRNKQLNSVCEAFRNYKNEGFDKVKLFRFDLDWKWSKESLEAVNILMMLFLELSDVKKRNSNKKTIDFKNVHELTDLTPEQKQRLEDYFYV